MNIKKKLIGFVVLVFSTNAFAIPTTVTGDGVEWTLSGTTSGNTGTFLLAADVSGAVSPLSPGTFYLDAFSLKNFGKTTATLSSLVATHGSSWDWVNEGLESKGCKTNGTDDALCIFNNSGDIFDAPSTAANFAFAFDITLSSGDLFPDYTHLKVRWVDENGEKVGDLISKDITWRKVPEPGVVALLAIGLISMVVVRRKKTV